jgi:hypothetical protein
MVSPPPPLPGPMRKTEFERSLSLETVQSGRLES